MLEDCLFASRPSARSKKPATLVLSVIVHGTLAGVLLVIPLFQNQVLPQIPLFEPLSPPVAPRAISVVDVPKPPSGTPPARMPEPSALIAPRAIPTEIVRYVDEPSSSTVGFIPAGPGGNGGSTGLPNGLDFGMPAAGPPPPPPAPPAPPPAPRPPASDPVPSAPVPRGGELMQSNLIHMVKPEYPRLAMVTHTQGTVILEAVITKTGTIDPARLRVISGHPLLTPAAVEAVQQWRYRPTTLNGQTLEILTTITVNFSLN